MTQMDISDDMRISNQKKRKKEKHLISIFSFFFGWCVVGLPQFLTHYLWISLIYMHTHGSYSDKTLGLASLIVNKLVNRQDSLLKELIFHCIPDALFWVSLVKSCSELLYTGYDVYLILLNDAILAIDVYSNALIPWSTCKFCTSSHMLGQTGRLSLL